MLFITFTPPAYARNWYYMVISIFCQQHYVNILQHIDPDMHIASCLQAGQYTVPPIFDVKFA